MRTSNYASFVPSPASATPTGFSLWHLASRPSGGQRYPPRDSVPYVHPKGAFVTRETESDLAFLCLACQDPIRLCTPFHLLERPLGGADVEDSRRDG